MALLTFQVSQFAGLDFSAECLGGLKQGGLERAVPAFGGHAGAVDERGFRTDSAGGAVVHGGSGQIQVDLGPERGIGFPQVFQDHLGGGDWGEQVQAQELFLDLSMPGVLGIEVEVSKSGFHGGGAGDGLLAGGRRRVVGGRSG